MNTIYCSKVFLIVLLVTRFPTQILAQNLAICGHTQLTKLCIDTLKSDSEGKSATTIEDVAMIMLKHATSKANEISAQLTNLLKQAQSLWGGDVVAFVYCSKNYQDAIRKLADSSKALQSKKYMDAKNSILGAMSANSKCGQDFKKLGRVKKPPVGYQGDIYNSFCNIFLQLTIRKLNGAS